MHTTQRVLAALLLVASAQAWGNNDDATQSEASLYGNALTRDWMYESTALGLKIEGCLWGFVSSDDENSGCLEQSSEDGTTYWYQMANCRRAQAVYSIYASGSSNSITCSANTFKETFVTYDGIGNFLSNLAENDEYGAFNGGEDLDALALCEQVNGNYVGMGCGDDGSFQLQYYSDAYCLTPSGKVYDKLNDLNSALSTYKSCAQIPVGEGGGQQNEGGGEQDENGNVNFNGLIEQLVYYSDTCSSLDSGLCSDSSSMSSRRSSSGGGYLSGKHFGSGSSRTWLTKLKYVAGGLLLLASFVMFTGILFTNRRRRRALMQRKYRQSRGDSGSRRSKSRSKSKTRDSSSRKSRSKSKTRRTERESGEAGVFT